MLLQNERVVVSPIFFFRTHFVHESDSMVLEDELQRIKLVGECIDVHHIVTGVVCALLGMFIMVYSINYYLYFCNNYLHGLSFIC